MIQRCTNPRQKCYYLYGDRGIKVCEQWRKFENFLQDMGEPPTDKHQIDRIDNDGDYCPQNCRWVTPKQNGQNKRNNHILTWNGMSKCISQWADELNIPSATLRMRILREWSIDKVLTTPVAQNKRSQKNV
jgi:hypothetical protein